MEEEVKKETKGKTIVFVVIIVLLLAVVGVLTMKLMSSEKERKEVATEEKAKEVEKETEKEAEKEAEVEEEQTETNSQNEEVPTPPAATSSFFTAPKNAVKYDEYIGLSVITNKGNIQLECSSRCHELLDSYWGKALKDKYNINGDYVSAKVFVVGHDATNLGIIAIRKDGTVSHNSLKNIVNGATILNPNYKNLQKIVSIESSIILEEFASGMQMVATGCN